MVSKLDTLGRVLSFDFDYFDYDYDQDRNYIVNTLSANSEFIKINQAAQNILDQSIDNYSAKVDVTHPIQSIGLSYGGKFSFSKTTNDFQSFNNITGTPVFDENISNEFEYKESVMAAYFNISKEISDKLEIKAGLRLENTITEGFSKTENEVNKNDYLKLFPTFYAVYKANENDNFSFSYGRRINRPGFSDLNPFRFYFNTNSYSEGNPFLQPSFSDNLNFYYTHKQKLTTNIYFSTVADGFGTITAPNGDNNTQVTLRRNYITEYTGGIGQIYADNITPWLYSRNQIYLIGYDSKFKENINAVPTFSLQLYFSTSNTFTIGETTKLQADLFYISPHSYSIYYYSTIYGLNIGLTQSFFSKKLQVSLLAHDIFDSGSINSAISEVNGVKIDFGSNYSRRYLRLSLSYNFGNNNISARNRKFGNDDTRRRTD